MSNYPSAKIKRAPKAVEASVGDEIVLMLMETGECVGLGDTGSEVWRQIATPIAYPDLVARLREIYDAPPGVIERDLNDLLRQLDQHKLIHLS